MSTKKTVTIDAEEYATLKLSHSMLDNKVHEQLFKDQEKSMTEMGCDTKKLIIDNSNYKDNWQKQHNKLIDEWRGYRN